MVVSICKSPAGHLTHGLNLKFGPEQVQYRPLWLKLTEVERADRASAC